jgi:DNA-binding transcriptional ArsR family regulator
MLNQSSDLDTVIGALADPTRRAIVERLGDAPASITELATPFSMSLPAVLQHVQVLERSGLVVTEKVGRVRTCRLEVEPLDNVQTWIAARRRTWDRRLDRLGQVVAGQPTTGAPIGERTP